MIPFGVRIPKSEWDRQLQEKLLQEAGGIMRWAIEGCLSWQEKGLDPPQIVTAAVDDYRSSMDVLGEFLRDRCVVAPEITGSKVYPEYQSWARETGSEELTGRAFKERMVVLCSVRSRFTTKAPLADRSSSPVFVSRMTNTISSTGKAR